MALRYWRGTTSDWTNTANWSATRTGATGVAIPASADDVFILDSATNIDPYGGAAVDLASLTIGGDFRGRILGLTIAVSGLTSINAVADIVLTAGTANIDDLRIYSTGGASVTLEGGTFTAVQIGSGNLVKQSTATVTTLNQAGGRVIDTGGVAYTTVNQGGGTLITLAGGTTLTTAGIAVSLSSAAWTTINGERGASYTHNSSGTIGTATSKPGTTFTDRPVGVQNLNGLIVNGQPTPFTLTNSVEWLGGSMFENNLAAITRTNPTTYVGKAG